MVQYRARKQAAHHASDRLLSRPVLYASPLPTPHSLPSAVQLIQFTHRLVVSLEPAFVRAEGRCVINATAVDGARAMFHMKHFVIEHEFYQGFRDRGAVKRT